MRDSVDLLSNKVEMQQNLIDPAIHSQRMFAVQHRIELCRGLGEVCKSPLSAMKHLDFKLRHFPSITQVTFENECSGNCTFAGCKKITVTT